MSKDILLITPPFTQLNTPYPATAYLKGFLNTKGFSSYQMDLGIEVILELFNAQNLAILFQIAEEEAVIESANAQRIFSLRNEYLQTIDGVIEFLQGKNPLLARLICSHHYLPQASRFEQINDLKEAFGFMGIQDKAKHLATLYLEDLSDFIVECIDEHFGFSRYAERMGRSANSFDELYDYLTNVPLSFIEEIALQLLEAVLEEQNPLMVAFSVPFPGNLTAAFRCASFIKENYPQIKVAMGGGFPNTELRSLQDNRVFEFFDFITLDDGELPIEILLSNIKDPSVDNPNHQLYKRTFLLDEDKVIYNNYSIRSDYKQVDCGTPDYSDLPLEDYISVIEIANPMHSLWSDGRWNKLTMAHGCYWGKCTFCDISLDYIKNYEPIAAKLLVDRMETLIKQTGENGFHFVDEAAPPSLMKELAIEILRRDISVTWWTNIRFEKSFTYDLCRLLQASGCIAVSGGLEVASDRLLQLIQKGVTVEQVAQVTQHFTQNGILVHAYLMYGYPTQTIQETIDSLEMVRQLFEAQVIQSAFWHQFALTAHSPIGKDPEAYGVIPHYEKIEFADNDIQFEDSTGIHHEIFSFGLKKSLFNYMHQSCLDWPLQEWFDFKIPKTSISSNYIQQCLNNIPPKTPNSSSKMLWLAGEPNLEYLSNDRVLVHLNNKKEYHSIELSVDKAEWFFHQIQLILEQFGNYKFADFASAFEIVYPEENLNDFWKSKAMKVFQLNGLTIV